MEALKIPLRLLRWRLRRARQWLRYGRLDAPVLFGNSFPKSGTHLLTQVLSGFAQLGPVVDSGLPAITVFEGDTGVQRPIAEILHQIDRLRPGDIGFGHLHALPEVVAALCREGVAPYFILRDPRDVAVSHVFFVTERESNHVHHEYYTQVLANFDARLRVSITGRPELDISFPDINARFAPYVGWLQRPEVLTLRFEQFIEDQDAALEQVLDHAIARGFRYDGNRAQAIQTLAAAIDPQRSPTFRSGKVGAWQEHFTPQHKELFKQVAGELLIALGYEKDLNW
jgi:hypothetical protein